MGLRLLVAGGCGFLGSNYIRYVLRRHRPDVVVNLDSLSGAGGAENVADVARDQRYRFLRGDIAEPGVADEAARGGFDAVVNFAEQSGDGPGPSDAEALARSNVQGTANLLEAARRHGIRRFLQVSTGRVYGFQAGDRGVREESPLDPGGLYAASKAGADLLIRAAGRTFGQEIVIVRLSDTYGPYQHPERFIPRLITRALEGKPCPLDVDGREVRDWIFVHDSVRAVHLVLEGGRPGGIYNVGGGEPWRDIEVAAQILRITGRPTDLLEARKDPRGRERRCVMDASKIERELGFRTSIPFVVGLKTTVEWYRRNAGWVSAARRRFSGRIRG